MQALDSKVQTLYDLYRDNQDAVQATKDVEKIRRRSETLGLLLTIGAFGLNEVARLTLRSRKYQMKLS
jgi:hypothetical protein